LLSYCVRYLWMLFGGAATKLNFSNITVGVIIILGRDLHEATILVFA